MWKKSSLDENGLKYNNYTYLPLGNSSRFMQSYYPVLTWTTVSNVLHLIQYLDIDSRWNIIIHTKYSIWVGVLRLSQQYEGHVKPVSLPNPTLVL